MKFETVKWDHTGLYCPVCCSWGKDTYKWHNSCRKLREGHIHVKCWKCRYEFATGRREC